MRGTSVSNLNTSNMTRGWGFLLFLYNFHTTPSYIVWVLHVKFTQCKKNCVERIVRKLLSKSSSRVDCLMEVAKANVIVISQTRNQIRLK
jgi:hypothetical protein